MSADVYDRVRRGIADSIDRDEWALMVWGKHWTGCTEHQRSEALRLRDTPFGGGFFPVAEPVSGSS